MTIKLSNRQHWEYESQDDDNQNKAKTNKIIIIKINNKQTNKQIANKQKSKQTNKQTKQKQKSKNKTPTQRTKNMSNTEKHKIIFTLIFVLFYDSIYLNLIKHIVLFNGLFYPLTFKPYLWRDMTFSIINLILNMHNSFAH